jgi:hypothetical protein
MQNIERQAQKNGVKLSHNGRCQYCGSNTKGGVFECFDIFNEMTSNFADGNRQLQFLFADSHCLQHSEVHGKWNNNLHLTRQYLMLEKHVEWNYSKTPLLSHTLDHYKGSHPDIWIPPLPAQERGRLTVTDLIGLERKELETAILEWAKDVFRSYERFHPQAKVVGDLYINKFER